MSVARSRFCQIAINHLGKVVLWGELDCSELVALALKGVGGPDLTKTHRAADMARETRPLQERETPLPGDLVFYGDPVEHVAIWLAGGNVISADGATRRITTLKAAKASESARVRYHSSVRYRRDFVGVHRNLYLDKLDAVSR